jgi:hypothetical protein
MLTDIFYILRKRYGSEGTQRVMLENLRYLRVCAVSAEDGVECLKSGWNDYEDCLLARVAENVKADYIVTRNKSDFGKSRIKAVSPDEILGIIESEKGLSFSEIDLGEI